MDVSHVAKLANITLKPGDEAKLQHQFEQTLKTVGTLTSLDTTGVATTSQVTGLTNVTRADVVDQSRILPPPTDHKGYFVVPSIFTNAD